MNETLLAELSALRFNDLTALAKALKGGTLGFDPNRKFTRPMKENFAKWIVGEFEETAIRGVLAEGGSLRQAGNDEAPARDERKPAPEGAAVGNQVAGAIAAALAGMQFGLTAEQTAEIARTVAAEVAEPLALKAAAKAIAEATIPRPIVVERKDMPKVELGVQHEQFEQLLALCAMRGADGLPLNVWLTGPAGSGKTTAAKNVSKALGVGFYFNGAIDNEYKLLGFTDAHGRIVSRPFREAWTQGGVYLFDEVDASLPGAVLAFNAALANGTCDFPDGNIERHKDCVIIAAANTWGTGATNEYVGRMKLDAAFVDRFVQLAWGYDESLEKAIAQNNAWVAKVQKVRKAVRDLGVRHVVSPRASYHGATMLANGMSEVDVIEMTIRKGLSDDQWMQVRTKAGL
jgi:cobaltochelatase CobS